MTFDIDRVWVIKDRSECGGYSEIMARNDVRELLFLLRLSPDEESKLEVLNALNEVTSRHTLVNENFDDVVRILETSSSPETIEVCVYILGNSRNSEYRELIEHQTVICDPAVRDAVSFALAEIDGRKWFKNSDGA